MRSGPGGAFPGKACFFLTSVRPCTCTWPPPPRPHASPAPRAPGVSLQELHACAFRAVASLLQPLDERLAHAWMLREVTLLLAPRSSSSSPDGEAGDDGSGSSDGRRASPEWLHAADLGVASPHERCRRGTWRGKSWWLAALPAVLACIEPDELLAALGARLPAAGRSLASQRAVSGLAAALLQRSAKAARNTIERVCAGLGVPADLLCPWHSTAYCTAKQAASPPSAPPAQLSGCLVAALSADDTPALHSLLLVCRRVLVPEDYASLIASAFGQHRAAACAAAADEPGAPAGAAVAAAAQLYCRLASALRAVNAGAPKGVLAAHIDLLNGIAVDWQVADQEAARNARNDLLQLIKACLQEQAATAGGDSRWGATCGMIWRVGQGVVYGLAGAPVIPRPATRNTRKAHTTHPPPTEWPPSALRASTPRRASARSARCWCSCSSSGTPAPASCLTSTSEPRCSTSAPSSRSRCRCCWRRRTASSRPSCGTATSRRGGLKGAARRGRRAA